MIYLIQSDSRLFQDQIKRDCWLMVSLPPASKSCSYISCNAEGDSIKKLCASKFKSLTMSASFRFQRFHWAQERHTVETPATSSPGWSCSPKVYRFPISGGKAVLDAVPCQPKRARSFGLVMFVLFLCDSLLSGHKSSGIQLHRLRDDTAFLSCLCIASGGALMMSGGDCCPHSAVP